MPRVIFRVFDAEKLDEIPMSSDSWVYALLRTGDEVVLAEVIDTVDGRGWCYADIDCVDEDSFYERMKEEETNADFFEFLRQQSEVFSDLYYIETEEPTETNNVL